MDQAPLVEGWTNPSETTIRATQAAADKCLAPRGGRRRSGALLLCIVELDKRGVGLLPVGLLGLIGHYRHPCRAWSA